MWPKTRRLPGVAFTGRIDLFSVSRIQRTLLKDLGQQP